MQIFVSYSRVDRTFTEHFVMRLRRLFPRDTVWYDEELHGGDVWWDEILNQIDACDIFIYLLSNESVTSPYCRAEFIEAQRLQKRIITVQVRDRTKLPPELGDIQYVEMKNGVDDPNAITDMGRAVNYQRDRLPPRKPRPRWQPRTARPSVPADSAPSTRDDVDTPDLTIAPVDTHSKSPQRAGWMTIALGTMGVVAVAIVLLVVIPGLFRSAQTETPTVSTTAVAAAPSSTATLDFAGAAQTFDALATAAAKATSLVLTQQFIAGQTATATLWTLTPTPTRTQTPNITASFQAFLTQRAASNQTAVATLWTRTPISTPTPMPTATSTSTLLPEQRALLPVVHNPDWKPFHRAFNGVPMMLVPTGCFQMGSNDGGEDEKPVNKQCFDRPFWIDQTEVPQEQFKQFGGYAANRPYFVGDQRPVDNITWPAAWDYCAKRGARLPTEAEWEYAARGPDSPIYPWGNSWDGSKAVWDHNLDHGTADVGSIPTAGTWVGALDMVGNVWEWTNSIYKPYPYNKGDGREFGENDITPRVLRGGAWSSNHQNILRPSYRLYTNGISASFSYGFRCARS